MNKKKSLLGFINWIFLASTFVVISCGKAPTQNDIYGVWKGEHLGKELMFKFNNDGTCVLNFKDSVSDSAEILIGNFKMNFSQKPITLSVRNIPQLNHPLHTIVEFVKMDSIKLANFSPRWRIRPITFDPIASMSLRRINNNE